MDLSAAHERRKDRWWELGGLAAILGLAVFYLRLSWLKWPDPTIDFGRELYIPWRLAQGDILYRDVDDFYGPFSQYFNASIFRVFGPGLLTLVTTNLIVFAAICAVLYSLFRTAWGLVAAQFSLFVFVSVFGFAQYVGIGNANYAAPYAHETTHGMLVCLLLVWSLLRWWRNATWLNSAWCGLGLGLSAVLKPEIMLAAAVVTSVALVLRFRTGARVPRRNWVALGVSSLLPTAAFFVYFAFHVSPVAAFSSACHAWLTATTTSRYVAESIQLAFLGFDQPWNNALRQTTASLLALAFIAFSALGARLIDRSRSIALQVAGSILLAALLFWIVWTSVDWAGIGRCFLGLILVYLAIKTGDLFRGKPPQATTEADLAKLLVAFLGAALMARMVLNGRIAQFGYYQAALAGIVIPAVVLTELPDYLGLRRFGRTLLAGCTMMSITTGVVILSFFSAGLFKVKTQPIADGPDRFFVMAPNEDPMGLVVSSLLDALKNTPSNQTMLVLPEGLMLNYLARKPSPVSPFFFFSAATNGGREAELVRQLERKPPDWVVIISRDLSEYGIKRYGEAAGHGKEMLEWVRLNYELTYSIGADPFESGQRAGRLYARKLSP